jgi:RNA polymerase sporulation-specific sigma factor
MGLVNAIASTFSNTNISFDDRMSIGEIYLMKAIDSFEIERGIEALSTYLGLSIKRGILQELRSLKKHKNTISIETPIGIDRDGNELLLKDVLGSNQEDIFNDAISDIKREDIKKALERLPDKYFKVITLRYLNGLTQKETGEILNLSRTTISKREKKALIKLRSSTKELKDYIE